MGSPAHPVKAVENPAETVRKERFQQRIREPPPQMAPTAAASAEGGMEASMDFGYLAETVALQVLEEKSAGDQFATAGAFPMLFLHKVPEVRNRKSQRQSETQSKRQHVGRGSTEERLWHQRN
ncbi:uncharacterized protein LOC121394214 isoform X4 [Xenopus laevis]|uniref:Uncharacterized protein LOC121394214 isoform X4 n=1 Tax=Xenopus laevis TaxID=8355 RepID=A0A8J1KT48_XENLA|nr:uncharacterized protein LOC121394214 isoform X4 [Xenopus laevis]